MRVAARCALIMFASFCETLPAAAEIIIPASRDEIKTELRFADFTHSFVSDAALDKKPMPVLEKCFVGNKFGTGGGAIHYELMGSGLIGGGILRRWELRGPGILRIETFASGVLRNSHKFPIVIFGCVEISDVERPIKPLSGALSGVLVVNGISYGPIFAEDADVGEKWIDPSPLVGLHGVQLALNNLGLSMGIRGEGPSEAGDSYGGDGSNDPIMPVDHLNGPSKPIHNPIIKWILAFGFGGGGYAAFFIGIGGISAGRKWIGALIAIAGVVCIYHALQISIG